MPHKWVRWAGKGRICWFCFQKKTRRNRKEACYMRSREDPS